MKRISLPACITDSVTHKVLRCTYALLTAVSCHSNCQCSIWIFSPLSVAWLHRVLHFYTLLCLFFCWLLTRKMSNLCLQLKAKQWECVSKRAMTKKTYAIQWTELLTTSETPFESLSELTPGTEVLAPYYNSGNKINYSIAIIGGKRQKEGECIIIW